jgi:hypothetical protein
MGSSAFAGDLPKEKLQRFMAKRIGAKTIEVKASHVSLISQRDVITKLILEAAGRA